MSGEKRKYLSQADDACKIFVGGLTKETTGDMLKGYFSYYGRVVDSAIMTHPETNKSRGFGFVTFEHPGAVDCVLATTTHYLDGKLVDPKKIVPKNLLPKGTVTGQPKRAFLGGLPLDMNENDLKNFFSSYGPVVESNIVYDDKTMKSRGFGFIAFQDESIIDMLIELHHIDIRGKQVEVKIARPRMNLATPAHHSAASSYASNPQNTYQSANTPNPYQTANTQNPYQTAGYPRFPHAGDSPAAKRMRCLAPDAPSASNYTPAFGGYPMLSSYYPSAGSAGVEPIRPPIEYLPGSSAAQGYSMESLNQQMQSASGMPSSFESMKKMMEQASQNQSGNSGMNMMLPLMMSNLMYIQQMQNMMENSVSKKANATQNSSESGEMMDMMRKMMQQMLAAQEKGPKNDEKSPKSDH